jgi:hypothetical protein
MTHRNVIIWLIVVLVIILVLVIYHSYQSETFFATATTVTERVLENKPCRGNEVTTQPQKNEDDDDVPGMLVFDAQTCRLEMTHESVVAGGCSKANTRLYPEHVGDTVVADIAPEFGEYCLVSFKSPLSDLNIRPYRRVVKSKVPSIEVQHTKLTKKINELDALKEDQVEHTQTLSTLQTQSTDLKKTSGELGTKITDLRNKLTAAQNIKNAAEAAEAAANQKKALATINVTFFTDVNYNGKKVTVGPGKYVGSNYWIGSLQFDNRDGAYVVTIYGRGWETINGRQYSVGRSLRIRSSENNIAYFGNWTQFDAVVFGLAKDTTDPMFMTNQTLPKFI